MRLLTAKMLTDEAKKLLKAGLITLEGNEVVSTPKASRIIETIALTDTFADEVAVWADEEIARKEAKSV